MTPKNATKAELLAVIEPDFAFLIYSATDVFGAEIPPAPGNVKFACDVTVMAVGKVPVEINPYAATLVDVVTNETYVPTFGGASPELHMAKLQPSETASGWITFEVPTTATGFGFHFQTYSPPGKVTFVLER